MMKKILKKGLLLVLALTLLCLSVAFAETSKTNWKQVDGKWFYVDQDGALLENDPSGLTLPPVDEAAATSEPVSVAQPIEQETEQEPVETEEPKVTEIPEETSEPEATEDPDEDNEPEATVDPEATETPEVNEDPEAINEPEVEDASAPLSVAIYASYDGEAPHFGDTIRLLSNITGAEDGATLHYQWQFSVQGGGWTDVAGANEGTYSYVLDQVNAQYTWRLLVAR